MLSTSAFTLSNSTRKSACHLLYAFRTYIVSVWVRVYRKVGVFCCGVVIWWSYCNSIVSNGRSSWSICSESSIIESKGDFSMSYLNLPSRNKIVTRGKVIGLYITRKIPEENKKE